MNLILNILYRICFIFILFSTATCQAEVAWYPFVFFKNVGGLNNGFSSTDIADNEASDLKNTVFSIGGSIVKRDGFAKLHTLALDDGTEDCTGITFFKKASGTKYLVSLWNIGAADKIYKMDYDSDGPDGTWDDITGALTFNISSDNLASFTVAEDTLIIEDGLSSTAPYKWSGAGNAAALGGSPPNAKVVEYYKNHLFTTGNNTNTSRVYWSNLDDIETWTTAVDFFDIDTNDGSITRGLKKGLDALYIWKDKSISRLSGVERDTFRLQTLIDDIGTLSHQSIALLKSSFTFVSDQGDVILYDGGLKFDNISNKIQGTIDASNFDRFAQAVGIEFDDDYYCNVSSSGSTTHDTTLFLDSFHLAWSRFDGINANAFCVADDGDGKDMLVFADYSGFAYKYPSGTDDAGSDIDFYYQTKQFRFDDLLNVGGGYEKYLRLVHVFVDQEGDWDLSVEVKNDFEGTGTVSTINLQSSQAAYGTARYGTDTYGGGNLITGRITPNEGKHFFQIKFSNANADEPVTIRGWYLWLEPGNRL